MMGASRTEQHVLLGVDHGAVDASATGAGRTDIPSRRLYLALFVCCHSPLLFGFSLGFTSPAQASMEGDAKGEVRPVTPPPDLTVFAPADFTMYAAVLNVGAVLGAFVGSSAMDRFGRKGALMLSAVPHMVAWGCMAFVSDRLLLQLLRALTGFAVGMGSSVAPIYIAEIAPSALRGMFGTLTQLSVCSGILLANIAGDYGLVVEEVSGEHFCNWRRLSAWSFVMAAILGGVAFVPESPKWLAQRGRTLEAQLALRMFRVGDTTAEESRLLDDDTTASGSHIQGRSPQLSDYRKSVVVVVGLMFFQQFSGVNAIMMYATDVCSMAGLDNVEAATMAIMVAQLAFSFVTAALVETAGRRSLMQVAGALMCVAHLGLSYYMSALSEGRWAPAWLALTSLCLFIVGFGVGMGPIPWIIISEVFPVEVVATASSLATAVMWTCSFVVCMGFRGLESAIGSSQVFALCAFFCFLCLVFVTTIVPETKGKTVEEILEAFRGQVPDASKIAVMELNTKISCEI